MRFPEQDDKHNRGQPPTRPESSHAPGRYGGAPLEPENFTIHLNEAGVPCP